MKPSAKRIAARWPGKETPDLEGMGDALDDLAADEREIEVIETNIADARVMFNEKVNKYTTYRAKFPNSIFAKVFNFGPMKFYEGSEEFQKFKEVDY